jgi:hypothetical protein
MCHATPPPTPPPSTPSPTPSGHETARTELYLLLLVMIPFVGRAFESLVTNALKSTILDKCFGGNPCARCLRSGKTGGYADGLNAYDIASGNCRMSWGDSVEALDFKPSMGLAVGALRLILWHWMQPVLYWVVLYAYWDKLDGLQHGLGLLVGVRELLYAFCTLCALWWQPIFLQANLSAQKERVKSFLFYVVMPDKYVASCCAFASGDCKPVFTFIMVLLTAADACATAALIAGSVRGNLPAALALGYVVATFGWVGIALLLCTKGGRLLDFLLDR